MSDEAALWQWVADYAERYRPPRENPCDRLPTVPAPVVSDSDVLAETVGRVTALTTAAVAALIPA